MNNFNNSEDLDKINSQLCRAYSQKIRLIRDIYREYELYLNLIRDLLATSVEKGLNKLYSYPLIKDNFLNANEFFYRLEKNISKLIHLNLPLLTIEQLKINEFKKNINKDINFNNLGNTTKIKNDQKEKFQSKDLFKTKEHIQFQINEDISNASDYYQAENNEKFVSLDLDTDYNDYLSDDNIEKIGIQKQFISALLELIEDVKVEKPRNSEKENINQMNISPKYQSLDNFESIDNSLENLLLNLSYEINQELFKANLIKNIISKDSFEYLIDKKLMIKHLHPFVINFELNINKSSSIVENYLGANFLNISTVELEFNNLNLSIKRNKINDLKNQFQRLIKKETYWRQKEITLNKIR